MSYHVDEYGNITKKKKKKEEEEKQPSFHVGEDGSITPIKTTNEYSSVGNSQKKRTWFTAGGFEDGYQKGDLIETVGDSALDLLSNFGGGFLEMGENAIDFGGYLVGGGAKLLGQDEFAERTRQFIASDLYDGTAVAKKILTLGVDPETQMSVFGDKVDSLAQSGGQLVGALALQGAGVPWWVTTGVTSFGGEVENAFRQDATYLQAGASGLITAGAEILTEKLFGGSGLGEKGLFDVSGLTKGIANKAWKLAADYGLDILTEGGEEVVSQFFGNLGSALYKEENLGSILFSEEALDGYLESFIGGGVMGGVMNAAKVNHHRKTGTDYRTDRTPREQKVIDTEVERRVAEREKGGRKLTNKERKAIEAEVENDFEDGSISVGTIEKALGGGLYDAYTQTAAQEDAILREYSKLDALKVRTPEQQARYDELTPQVEEIRNDSKSGRLKTQLSSEAFELSKGSRLVRSYQEQAKKREAFTADLSQYNYAQQQIVKRAIDSGILNNTTRTHKFVDFIARISADKGVLFDFTNNEKLRNSGFAVDGKVVNGYITRNGITVNIQSGKALNSVVGHEITHVLEGTELYGELQKALFQYARTRKEFGKRYAELEELYKNVEGADIDAELTADLVGDYLFTDAEFINNLAANHRNIFEKIFDEIKHLLKLATAGSKEARELEKVKKAFEKAYRDAKFDPTKKTEKKTTARTEVETEDIEVETEAESEIDDDIAPPIAEEKVSPPVEEDIAPEVEESSAETEVGLGSAEHELRSYLESMGIDMAAAPEKFIRLVESSEDNFQNEAYRNKVQKKMSAMSEFKGMSGFDPYSFATEAITSGFLAMEEDLSSQPKKKKGLFGRKKYSLSSMASTFFGDENMSAVAFEEADYTKTDGYRNYVEQCLNNYRQTRPNFDEAVARKEIEDSIAGIVQVALAAKRAGYDIYDDATKRDKRDSKKRLLFSSLEPNSDYFTSSDISTICDKRKNFAQIYDDIVRAEEAKGVPAGKRFFSNVDNYFYLHKLMADKGLTQPCRQCYVESMRKNLAPMANAFMRLVTETDPNNMRNDQLFHQRGKNKGNPKTNNTELRKRVLELLDAYGMSVGDLSVETLTTAEGLAELKIKAPEVYEAFNSFYGQSKPKMPKGATPFRFGELTALLTDEHGRIKKSLLDKINSTGGFRLQSYSDFQIQNYTDVLQVIFEAGTLGLTGHAYTKVPAFLEATEGTNLKRNISIFMYKDGGEWKLDRNDSFPYTLEQIYDIVKADKTGNTSIIAVSQNDDMSAWIMANELVGYGIPFHKSGLKMGTVRDTDVITDDGRVVKGYSGTKDHTRQQSEVYADSKKKVKKGIDIYEFWDFENKGNLPKNELIKKNLMAYIDACDEAGYLPKFRDYVMGNGKVLNSVLAYAKKLGFAPQDATIDDISFEYKGYRIPYGYYKFLGDFGMFTPDGMAAPQQPLSLTGYDFAKASKFFADAEALRRTEILQQFANGAEREKYRKSDLTAGELADIVKQKRGEVVDEVVRYSLSPVEPVQPTSDGWSRTATTEEAKELYPKLWDVAAEESDTRNPTQIAQTVGTYRRIYEYLAKEGFDGTILDASSGLGYGTKAGIEEYGFDVEDIEPYPDKSYNPMYTDYSALDKKYDAIISSFVLNVLPQDQRDALVARMGELLNDGGRMFINVRGNDVRSLGKKSKNIQLGDLEFIETSRGSYQKGFKPDELVAYLRDALGEGFTVEPTRLQSAVAAIVTKNGAGAKYSLSEETDSDGGQLSYEQAEYFRDSKMRDADGKLIAMYHGTQNGGFYEFNPNRSDDGISLFFVDRNDVAGSYSGTSETYAPRAFKTASDLNAFFAEIGKRGYKVAEEDGKYTLYDDDFEVSTSKSLDDLFEDFKDWEGVGYGSVNYKVYLNLTNPLVVDAHGMDWHALPSVNGDKAQYEYIKLVSIGDNGDVTIEYSMTGDPFPITETVDLYKRFDDGLADTLSNLSPGESVEGIYANPSTTRDYAKYAKDNGYDGVIFKNVRDNGGYSNGSEGASTVAIAFDSNQVKSVANTNPTADPDLRYSLSEEGAEHPVYGTRNTYSDDVLLDIAPAEEELFPDSQMMESDEDFYDRTASLTDEDAPPERPFYGEDVQADIIPLTRKVAADIRRNVRDSLALSNKHMADVEEIVDRYSRSEFPSREQLFGELKEKFGTYTESFEDETVREAKAYMRSYGLLVDSHIKSEIADYAQLMRSLRGRMRFSKNGTPVNVRYSDLSAEYPHLFPEDIIAPTDQFLRMVEVARMDSVNEVEMDVDDASIYAVADSIIRSVDEYRRVQKTREANNYSSEAFDSLLRDGDAYAPPLDDDDIAPPTPNESYSSQESQDVDARVDAKVANLRTELAENQRLQAESRISFDEEIARLQAEYNAKKNKRSIAAHDLLRRIERVKRLKNNVDADYAKRIRDLEDRLTKASSPAYRTAEHRKDKQAEYTALMEELVGDTSTWKDKKLGISYKTNTLRRNLRYVVRDAYGRPDIEKADAIYDELQGNYNRHEASLNRESTQIKQPYAELHITSAEDAYIQMLGELRYNPDTTLTREIVDEYYEKHKKHIDTAKVDQVIEDARKTYDELLKRVNAVLREQGMKEIPYRQGYFPHFTDPKQGFLSKLFNWRSKNYDIPTDIAGLTEQFNPNRSWQSFNKERKGDVTDYSFLKGMDSYVHGALDWIYHIEDIQKRRALENYIRYIHSEQGVKDRIEAIRNSDEYDADEMQEQIDLVYAQASNPLNNFVVDLRAGTNTLAGKKSSLDRGIEELANRTVYDTMTNLNNRVSANMVVGSISSALTNFIPITQSWGQVSPLSSLRAMVDTIRSTVHDDGTIEKSAFLTNRLRGEESLYKTTWDKIGEKATFLMNAIDSFTSQTVWRSKYLENISNGMSENEAIQDADQFAENVIAGRSRGNMPTIFDSKNPLTKIFTSFQLEVANQYGYMFKDMPQDMREESVGKLAKGYATMFIGAYAYNALYSSLVGRDAAFDPIGIIQDLLGDLGLLDDDEEEEPVDAIINLADNILEEVPFVGGLAGGGRVPIGAAIPYDGVIEAFKGTMTDVNNKDWGKLTKEWLKPIYYMAMPMGGGQLKKTIEGLSMFSNEHPVAGSYTNSGDLRFPVEDTPLNIIQSALFGQYSNENARYYFDHGLSPMSPKQTQEYIDVDIPIRDYWDYREGLKGKDTLGEKVAYISNLDLPIDKKNILVNNQANRKEPIDLTDFDEYGDWGEFDYAKKYPDKYSFLQANGITAKEYDAFDEDTKQAYSWAYQNPEKFTLSKAVTNDVVTYRSYTGDLSEITADKDEDGKAISGSRKEKVIAYINGLDLDYGAKIVLFKSQYPSDDTYNYEIVEYLESRADFTFDDKFDILTELGFTVLPDGTVQWD